MLSPLSFYLCRSSDFDVLLLVNKFRIECFDKSRLSQRFVKFQILNRSFKPSWTDPLVIVWSSHNNYTGNVFPFTVCTKSDNKPKSVRSGSVFGLSIHNNMYKLLAFKVLGGYKSGCIQTTLDVKSISITVLFEIKQSTAIYIKLLACLALIVDASLDTLKSGAVRMAVMPSKRFQKISCNLTRTEDIQILEGSRIWS